MPALIESLHGLVCYWSVDKSNISWLNQLLISIIITSDTQHTLCKPVLWSRVCSVAWGLFLKSLWRMKACNSQLETLKFRNIWIYLNTCSLGKLQSSWLVKKTSSGSNVYRSKPYLPLCSWNPVPSVRLFWQLLTKVRCNRWRIRFCKTHKTGKVLGVPSFPQGSDTLLWPTWLSPSSALNNHHEVVILSKNWLSSFEYVIVLFQILVVASPQEWIHCSQRIVEQTSSCNPRHSTIGLLFATPAMENIAKLKRWQQTKWWKSIRLAE